MIVVMKKDALPSDIEHLVQKIEKLGLKSHTIIGTERTVVAIVGDERKVSKDSLEIFSESPKSCPSSRPTKSPVVKSRKILRESRCAISKSALVTLV